MLFMWKIVKVTKDKATKKRKGEKKGCVNQSINDKEMEKKDKIKKGENE